VPFWTEKKVQNATAAGDGQPGIGQDEGRHDQVRSFSPRSRYQVRNVAATAADGACGPWNVMVIMG